MDSRIILCPSARPEMPGSAAFGVVLGSVEQPRVAFLEHAIPVTEELLGMAAPVSPTEVFRFSAPCAGNACQHFDGTDCRLVTRIVERLPLASGQPAGQLAGQPADRLPDCAIRSACRWWRQEGEDACLRCPLVATESYGAAEIAEPLRVAADPLTPVSTLLPVLR